MAYKFIMKKGRRRKISYAILTKFRKQIGKLSVENCDKIEKKGIIFLHIKSSNKSIKMSSH